MTNAPTNKPTNILTNTRIITQCLPRFCLNDCVVALTTLDSHMASFHGGEYVFVGYSKFKAWVTM